MPSPPNTTRRNPDTLDVEVFRKVLKRRLKNAYEDFDRALVESNAVVAGGGVLGPYAGFRSEDLDIYVNVKNFLKLYESLLSSRTLKCKFRSHHLAPAYDQSFFRKNNIMARFHGQMVHTEYFDIMIVPDNIPLRQVVQNFDLVCCEVWYDGHSVYATDKIGIETRKTQLRPEYSESLIKHFNFFIINRIKKYKKRGFSIDILPLASHVDFQFPSKTVTDPEEWIVKLILEQITIQTLLPTKKVITILQNIKSFKIAELNNAIRKVGGVRNNEGVIISGDIALKDFYTELLSLVVDYLRERNNRFYVYIKQFGLTDDDSSFHEENDDEAHSDNNDDEHSDDNDDQYNSDGYNDEDNVAFTTNDDDEEHSFDYDRNSNDVGANSDDIEYKEVPSTNFEDFIKVNGSGGFDPIAYEEIDDVNKYLINNTNTIVLVGQPTVACKSSLYVYDRDSIQTMLSNRDDNWLYECIGQEDESGDRMMEFNKKAAYVGIPLDCTGMKAYIRVGAVTDMLKSRECVFFINPYMVDGVQKMITHTASYKNVFDRPLSNRFVSANHCQGGSNILIYELVKCNYNPQQRLAGGRNRQRKVIDKKTIQMCLDRLKKASLPSKTKPRGQVQQRKKTQSKPCTKPKTTVPKTRKSEKLLK